MNIPTYVWLIAFVVLCFAVLTQLFYYLYFFRRLAFYKAPAKAQSQEYPVSVVICGRDEAENLATNLPGVLVQQYRSSHEVIMVNDNSVDDSKYVLDELKKTFKHLIPLDLTQEAMMIPGKKFPLSMGIKSAKYEIVLLTDADCLPASEHWIQLMQDGFAPDKEIVLGYGAYKKRAGLLNKIIRFETFHTALQYLSYALAGTTYMGVGRNLAYKKTLFIKNKGFSAINQIPGGDDDLFINKVATANNTAIVINPDAFTLSEPKHTWQEWMRQKTRHFSTAKYYLTKHKQLLGLYAFSHGILYPSLVISCLFFNWWLSLCVYGVRLIIQGIVLKKAMHKLKEDDLWPLYPLFDIWMIIYYFLFIPSLWKKPAANWR